MWKVTYTVLSSDGELYKNVKEVKKLSDFNLFNTALHHGAANIVAVKDPMGRLHDRRTAMKRGF